ncbi:MAG: hypothetical protein HC880_18715 [Bacteroidia bacterium]|nr:hypothetical protein [Bacteroidia bacterium]
MEKKLRKPFKSWIYNSNADFERKMEQNQLFQLQERLSEKIIAEVKQDKTFSASIPELAVHEKNAKDLEATGKNYKNVLEEKIFTDGFRIFEEFLANIFTGIFSVFPNLLLVDKDRYIDVPFEHVFINPDIKRCQDIVIEKKVKSYLQGDNISKILDRFKSTFDLVINVTPDQKNEIQRISLIRNIIIHNNSVINEIYVNSIRSFKILNDSYAQGNSILPNLESEINEQRKILKRVSEQIIKDLEKEKILKNFTRDIKARHKTRLCRVKAIQGPPARACSASGRAASGYLADRIKARACTFGSGPPNSCHPAEVNDCDNS